MIGSGGLPETLQIEDQRPPPAGFPPNLIGAYPIATGSVIRQTASGWSDEEHARNNVEDPLGEYPFYDMVYQPDPTAAVLVNEAGSSGWAVGGFFNSANSALDTADVARYREEGVAPLGVGSAPVQTNKAQIEATAGQPVFAIGGGAQCAAACADRARAGIGPDVWLSTALAQAQKVPGLRAFLYTGPRVTTGIGHGLYPVPYSREFARYAELLGAAGGTLPTFAAPSPSDRGPGSECDFQQAFEGFSAPLGTSAAGPGVGLVGEGEASQHPTGACTRYYAFSSQGTPTGAVRVIVLDTSAEGEELTAERGWLAGQLAAAAAAAEPAIVVGNADLNAEIAAGDSAAGELAQTINQWHASAYFYDAPEQNLEVPLDGTSTPAFGSGTLGYVSSVKAQEQDFIGASGFLLVHIDVAARAADDVAPVSARLIPNIGELALEAEQGTLLRRSQSAEFNALARRPRAGGRSGRNQNSNESDLYIPIPENCVGSQCAKRIAPEYSFSSSEPKTGNFVTPNLASAEPHAVLLGGAKEEPITDEESGLFCAYNPGEVNVTISAGGLSFTLPVTIEAGSVRRPCGTVPAGRPAAQTPVPVPPPPAPAPAPAPAPTPAAATAPPPVPPPPLPVATPVTPPPARPVPPVPFTLQPGLPATLLPFVPPPVPTPARPTPPTGTSAVTSPIEVAEREEEREEAPESVSNKALAYSAPEHEPMPAYILGIVVLAALAGAGVRRRPRRGRRELHVAHATLNTSRTQQRNAPRRRPPWQGG